MTILEAVGDYLQSAALGTLGSDLFLAVMPTAPDTVVCVYETPGFAPQATMGSAGWAVDQPGLQVICRAERGDYPGARNAAEAIREALSELIEQTVSGVHIMRISPDGGVLPIGDDENGRPLVSVNFSCQVLP